MAIIVGGPPSGDDMNHETNPPFKFQESAPSPAPAPAQSSAETLARDSALLDMLEGKNA